MADISEIVEDLKNWAPISLLCAELAQVSELVSFGVFGTPRRVNWWTQGLSPEAYLGDVDLYFVVDCSRESTRRRIYEIVESVTKKLSEAAPESVFVSFGFKHGPFKPRYEGKRHLFLHCIIDEQYGWEDGCRLFRWFARDTAICLHGRSLQELFPAVKVSAEEVLHQHYGIRDLKRALDQQWHRIATVGSDGEYGVERQKLSGIQLIEFSIFCGVSACKMLARLNGARAARDDSWQSDIRQFVSAQVASELDELLQLRDQIRSGAHVNKSSGTIARSALSAQAVLQAVQSELEKELSASSVFTQYDNTFRDAKMHRMPFSADSHYQVYVSCQAQLKMLTRAVSHVVSSSDFLSRRRPCVVAIGSLGRMDGRTTESDVDLVVICDLEYLSSEEKDIVRQQLYAPLVTHNTCMLFDHRQVFEDTLSMGDQAGAEQMKLISGREYSYPVVARSQLTSLHRQMLSRRIQLLFEATPVYNEEMWMSLCSDIQSHYSIRRRGPESFVTPGLLKDFEAHANGMWQSLIEPRRQSTDMQDSRTPASNKKVAKGLFLRDAHSRIDALSVALTTFNKHRVENTRDYVSRVSSPPFIKLLRWLSVEFLGWVENVLPPDAAEAACIEIERSRFVSGRVRSVAKKRKYSEAVFDVIEHAMKELIALYEWMYGEALEVATKRLSTSEANWRVDEGLSSISSTAAEVRLALQALADIADITFQKLEYADRLAFPYKRSNLERWTVWARDWEPKDLIAGVE